MRLLRVLLVLGVLGVLAAALRALFEDNKDLLGLFPSSSSNEFSSSRSPSAGEDGTSELTKEELYEQAKHLDIEGRSKMSKRELKQAVARRSRSRS